MLLVITITVITNLKLRPSWPKPYKRPSTKQPAPKTLKRRTRLSSPRATPLINRSGPSPGHSHQEPEVPPLRGDRCSKDGVRGSSCDVTFRFRVPSAGVGSGSALGTFRRTYLFLDPGNAMRSVSYVQRTAMEFSGSLFPHAICLGDVDNDTVSVYTVRPAATLRGATLPQVRACAARVRAAASVTLERNQSLASVLYIAEGCGWLCSSGVFLKVD